MPASLDLIDVKLLEEIQAELAPRDGDNRLVPLITAGRAPRAVFAALAAEEKLITLSDWRSFHALAARAAAVSSATTASWPTSRVNTPDITATVVTPDDRYRSAAVSRHFRYIAGRFGRYS